MTEEWRDIEGLEGKYKVSNFGNILSLKFNKQTQERLLKLSTDSDGYAVIHIGEKMRKVHRLVAEAFLPKIDGKDFVNHIDGNKKNNRVENLEWVTCAENARHARAIGLLKPVLSPKARQMSIEKRMRPVSQYDDNGNHIRDFDSITAAGRAIARNQSSISMCLAGRRKHCGGYVWKYKD